MSSTAVRRLGTIARLAWRESRTARRRLLFYTSSIALGVATLVAIDSFAADVRASIRQQARSLMGGDVSFKKNAAFSPAAEQLFDSMPGRGTEIARNVTFGSMARAPRTGNTRLVQINAITPGYPFYTEVRTDPAGLWPQLHGGRHVAIVDPSLLVSLDARVGDTLALGQATFEILGVIASLPLGPTMAGGPPSVAALLGQRVYIAQPFLSEMQLTGTGSLVTYETVVKLPPNVDSDEWTRPIERGFGRERVNIVTVARYERMLSRAVRFLADFLGILGFMALLLGGIGVASGVHAFITRKTDTVAILRCLGATGPQVLAIYIAQAIAMGLAGAALGAVLGVAVQFALPRLLAGSLPLDLRPSLDWSAIGQAFLVGTWVALVFALRPLLGLRRVSPLAALRRDAAALGAERRRDPLIHLVNLALVASVLLLAIERSGSRWRGQRWAIGIGIAVLALSLSAALLSALARRLVRARWPYVIRQGLANLHRPANQTRPVVLSLGFGSFLVSTLFLVQANLIQVFESTAASSRGNLVFFDVQEDQHAGLDSIVRSEGQLALSDIPIVMVKIAGVNGMLPQEWARTHGFRPGEWFFRYEFRSTYRDTLLREETLLSGQAFGRAALPDTLFEVSLDRWLASGIGLDIGDVVTWDVQGVKVSTRLANTRETAFQGRFEPRFNVLFDSRAMAGAPKQFVTVLAVPSDTAIARLQRKVAARYPNISSVDLSLVRRTLQQITDKVSTAVRFLALFALVMGIPVLFSAVGATRADRLREGVLLKTLGATRRQIRQILLAEYAVLGTMGALAGMLLSFGGAWGLMTIVFETSFSPALAPALTIALVMVVLAVTIGLATGRDVFRETPMTALREV